jgi:hypothetical protein
MKGYEKEQKKEDKERGRGTWYEGLNNNVWEHSIVGTENGNSIRERGKNKNRKK